MGAGASSERDWCKANNSDFAGMLSGQGLQGSLATLVIERRQQGRETEGGRDQEAWMVSLERQAPKDSRLPERVIRLQPLEWVHLWPGQVAGRARSDLQVAYWRQFGGSAADAGVMCFAHDMGIRPEVFHCRDHHLLFLNDPAANVSQTLPHPVAVPSTITVKALVDCCGAGWQGHSCDAHGQSGPRSVLPAAAACFASFFACLFACFALCLWVHCEPVCLICEGKDSCTHSRKYLAGGFRVEMTTGGGLMLARTWSVPHPCGMRERHSGQRHSGQRHVQHACLPACACI